MLLPFELTFLTFGTLGGKLSDAYGYAPMTLLGLIPASVSLHIVTHSTQTLPQLIVASKLLPGCGAGPFVTPNASSMMASPPAERRGVTSSTGTIPFNVGFALGSDLRVLLMTRTIPLLG